MTAVQLGFGSAAADTSSQCVHPTVYTARNTCNRKLTHIETTLIQAVTCVSGDNYGQSSPQTVSGVSRICDRFSLANIPSEKILS